MTISAAAPSEWRGHQSEALFTSDLRPLALPPLPVSLTSLVGRERLLDDVRERFPGPTRRLLTLTGPGGVGKTRIALALAAGLSDRVDGVVFVSLAPLAEPALVLPTIARMLGLPDAPGRPLIARLTEALRERRLLLVLDNFEHVIEAAPVVGKLLRDCSGLCVLVTSRGRLRLSGEQEYPVPPLDVPTAELPRTAEESGRSAAVALFVARARAADPAFALTDDNASAIVEICHRLDGLPLAIELAAARVRLLSPTALAARLEWRLPLLTGGPRDEPTRLRTMRDAIAWSYDLLDADEQALFCQLAVFVGGFTLDAAERVVSHESWDVSSPAVVSHDVRLTTHGSVLDGIALLVDKSLLRHVGDDGEPRYAMLETIREFGLERLEVSGEAERVRRRHAEWCLRLAEGAWQTFRQHPHSVEWLGQMEEEHDNLRAALAWLARAGEREQSLQLAGALWPFWYFRSHFSEGRRWLDQAMANSREASTPARARALLGAGDLAHYQGDETSAVPLVEQSLALHRTLDDPWGASFSLMLLGAAAENQGAYDRAAPLFATARALFGQASDTLYEALTCYHLGVVAYGQGDLAGAMARCEEALRLARPAGNTFVVAWTLNYLGLVACEQGDDARAAAAFAESLALEQASGHQELTANVLANLAVLAAGRGHPRLAARLFGAANALCLVIGRSFALPERAAYERVTSAVRNHLGEQAFTSAWAEGQAMPSQQAIAEASALISSLTSPEAVANAHDPGAHAGLTCRQLEVLLLLAEGHSDREISQALSLSHRTVQTHVSHILAKFGVPSRSAAVAHAHRHDLV
ncbi:MAG: ATP-binding protein [Thermomicrobiales bacterium]